MKKANNSINLKDLQPETVQFILDLEKVLGYELTITSGFRGPEHPIEAAKKSPGEHSTGLAIDVYCKYPLDFLKLTGEAYKLGCLRVGVSRKGNFIHLGLDKSRPSSLWTY